MCTRVNKYMYVHVPVAANFTLSLQIFTSLEVLEAYSRALKLHPSDVNVSVHTLVCVVCVGGVGGCSCIVLCM